MPEKKCLFSGRLPKRAILLGWISPSQPKTLPDQIILIASWKEDGSTNFFYIWLSIHATAHFLSTTSYMRVVMFIFLNSHWPINTPKKVWLPNLFLGCDSKSNKIHILFFWIPCKKTCKFVLPNYAKFMVIKLKLCSDPIRIHGLVETGPCQWALYIIGLSQDLRVTSLTKLSST